MENYKSRYYWYFGMFWVLIVAFNLNTWVFVPMHKDAAFAKGYCTALSGEAINNETCNVDGKVVVIP